MKIVFFALIALAKLSHFASGQGFKTSGSFVLGQYAIKNATTGISSTKTYYLSKIFKTDWMGAFNFCKDNKMNLLTLADSAEATNFFNLCLGNKNQIPAGDFFIGGYSSPTLKSKTGWSWYETGEKISYTLTWATKEPNNVNSKEFCMGIKYGTSAYGFSDVKCYQIPLGVFVCQDITTP